MSTVGRWDWPSQGGGLSPRLVEAARIQGRMWRRGGADVAAKLRVRSPEWPGSPRQRVRLILAALAGALEVGDE
jgi:hypothetical protein